MAGRGQAGRPGLVTHSCTNIRHQSASRRRNSGSRPRLGALIKLIVKGPSFLRQTPPRRSPATTTTADAALSATAAQPRECFCLRLAHFSSAAGLLTSHG
jgi:hypothetical protein